MILCTQYLIVWSTVICSYFLQHVKIRVNNTVYEYLSKTILVKLFTSGDSWQNSEEKHGLKTVFLRYESSFKVLIKNITREHKFR
jgi:hypothetical protein